MLHLLSFSGKSDRFEWWTVSALADLALQLCIIFGLLAVAPTEGKNYLIAVLLLIIGIVCFWLALTVSVRRLRDRGRAPWLLVLAFVPVVGWIWYVIECGFLGSPGQKGSRKRKVVRRTVTPANAEQVRESDG